MDTKHPTIVPLDIIAAAQEGTIAQLQEFFHTATLKEKEAALRVAVYNHKNDAVEWLIKQGVDVNACNDENFRTAIIYAAQVGNIYAINLLLENGASPTTVAHGPYAGWTPIYAAAALGHADAVKIFLNHGASPTAILEFGPAKGSTALKIAIEKNNNTVVSAIKEWLKPTPQPTEITSEKSRDVTKLVEEGSFL